MQIRFMQIMTFFHSIYTYVCVCVRLLLCKKGRNERKQRVEKKKYGKTNTM